MTGTVYPRRRFRRRDDSGPGCLLAGCMAALAALVVVCGWGFGWFLWAKDNCEDRGGHIALIWGSDDTLWTCDGVEEGLGQ